jgi:DNA-binding transcriptional ArsR family regulator
VTIQQLSNDFNPPELDPQIDWVPINLAAALLGIHPSQVRRDRAVLEELELITYANRSNGFRRDAFLALWIFRQLVRQRGRTEAIHQITDYLEEYYERERQTSSSRSQAPP